MARPRTDIAPRIVHAARERFLAEGVDGASLRQIAKEAGTSIGMVYYYFPSKDDLFLAVVEEIYAALLADVAKALSPDAPFSVRLERMYLRFAAMSEEEFRVVRMVLRELMASEARLGRVLARFARGHVPLVIETVADGIRTGAISKTHHPASAAIAIMSLGIAPQVVRHLIGARGIGGLALPSAEELARDLAQIVLGGVGGV